MGRWAYLDIGGTFREREMRKMDARWDVDVPDGDTDGSEGPESERVHFGIRLGGRGRHEADRSAGEYGNIHGEPSPTAPDDVQT